MYQCRMFRIVACKDCGVFVENEVVASKIFEGVELFTYLQRFIEKRSKIVPFVKYCKIVFWGD